MISIIAQYLRPDINIYLTLLLDFVLFLVLLISGDRTLLIMYLSAVSVALVLEYLYRQMNEVALTFLTEENLKLYSFKDELKINPNLKLQI